MLIQIILMLVFLLLLLRILRQRTLGIVFKIVSMLLVALASYVVLFPDVSNRVARFAGVGRGADLIIYICMTVGAYILIVLYMHVKSNELRIARLVQRLAIEKRHIEDLTSNLHASRES
jgi:hypothetical protein